MRYRTGLSYSHKLRDSLRANSHRLRRRDNLAPGRVVQLDAVVAALSVTTLLDLARRKNLSAGFVGPRALDPLDKPPHVGMKLVIGREAARVEVDREHAIGKPRHA